MSRVKDQYHRDFMANSASVGFAIQWDEGMGAIYDNYKPALKKNIEKMRERQRKVDLRQQHYRSDDIEEQPQQDSALSADVRP